MQAAKWLNLAVLVQLVLVALCFLIGYAAGKRGKKPLGIISFTVVETLGLIGTGITLSTRFGPLMLGEMALLTVAVDFAIIGGYLFGLRTVKPALPTLLMVLLLADLVGFYVVNSRLLEIVKETGFIKDTPQTPQTPEAPVVQDSAENLKQLYNAFSHYADSNEGSLPPAENWMDNEDLKGYIQKDEWLHDPAVSNGKDDKFGYAYNDAVAGRKLKEIPAAAKTPLLYESSNTAKNAHDAVTSLPKPGRHNGKNAILYCDGHVETVAPK